MLRYAAEQGIESGCIFITRGGKPISRTNIWRDMKALCKEADVNPNKVFPHNLRHLFARCQEQGTLKSGKSVSVSVKVRDVVDPINEDLPD